MWEQESSWTQSSMLSCLTYFVDQCKTLTSPDPRDVTFVIYVRNGLIFLQSKYLRKYFHDYLLLPLQHGHANGRVPTACLAKIPGRLSWSSDIVYGPLIYFKSTSNVLMFSFLSGRLCSKSLVAET